MKKDFGNDFITISDDNGNNYELEHIDTMEINGEYYLAFLPADMDENDENYGFVILKMIEGDGDENYFVVPDDDIIDEIYDKFMEQLYSDSEEE